MICFPLLHYKGRRVDIHGKVLRLKKTYDWQYFLHEFHSGFPAGN
jgi:hypothetical protein